MEKSKLTRSQLSRDAQDHMFTWRRFGTNLFKIVGEVGFRAARRIWEEEIWKQKTISKGTKEVFIRRAIVSPKQSAISHLLRCRSHTFLRSREDVEIFSCCSTAQSMEGTASFLSHLLERNEDVSPRFRSARCSKYDESKCTEQITDVFHDCHFARCRWTKRIHFSRIASSRGNICRKILSDLELLVQLTFLWLPATQNLPEDLFFGFCTHSSHTMLTRGLLWVTYIHNQWRHMAILAAPKWRTIFGLTNRLRKDKKTVSEISCPNKSWRWL